MVVPTSKKCWATLMTKDEYLAGALVVDASLKRHGSGYPLVVYAPPTTLSKECREVLEVNGIRVRDIDYITQPEGVALKDERFAETWTKLAAFCMYEYERVVMVDSDMIVRGNMDELMTMPLEKGHIAAAHACTCNPRKFTNYPSSWIPENCGFTLATLEGSLPSSSFTKETHHLLNSGLVVLEPNPKDFEGINAVLATDVINNYRFPDQDLLAHYFRGKFDSIGYQYNALKTLRHCHENIWRDEDVKNVHFILTPKPWGRKLRDDDTYALTHSWWWEEYEDLVKNWGDKPHLDLVEKCVNRTPPA